MRLLESQWGGVYTHPLRKFFLAAPAQQLHPSLLPQQNESLEKNEWGFPVTRIRYGRIRQDTAGYGRIRQDTAGYGAIRQDTAGYGRIRQDTQDTAGYGRIRQDTADTAGYGRIRQDTAGYDRVQNICLFALRKQPFCVHSAFGGISYCSCMPIVTFPADNPLHVHQLFVSKKKEIATCFLSLVVFSSCSCVPIVLFLFRLTTRLAAHQFSVLKKKMIAT